MYLHGPCTAIQQEQNATPSNASIQLVANYEHPQSLPDVYILNELRKATVPSGEVVLSPKLSNDQPLKCVNLQWYPPPQPPPIRYTTKFQISPQYSLLLFLFSSKFLKQSVQYNIPLFCHNIKQSYLPRGVLKSGCFGGGSRR